MCKDAKEVSKIIEQGKINQEGGSGGGMTQ